MANNSLSLDFNHTRLLSKKNKHKLLKVFSQIIDSGIFINGKQADYLRKKLADLLGGGYVNLVSSGHDALLLALSALKLSSKDEIILPANAYPTALAVGLTKGKIVLVDVDENGQIDPKKILSRISPKTKVIIIVHLYGLVGQIKEILKIAKKNKIIIVEDVAQAFGSTFENKLAGTMADIGCFSFYPTKNLPTLGDGGAIWTKHADIFNSIRKAKMYGENTRYRSEFVSGHSRLSEIQSASSNIFLKSLKKNKQKRVSLYNYFRKQIDSHISQKFVRVLETVINSIPFYHLFAIEAKKRDRLRNYLKKQGIETHIHYPYPIHLVPAFYNLGYKKGIFPMSERLSRNILSLPFHQYMTKKQIQFIVSKVKDFYFNYE